MWGVAQYKYEDFKTETLALVGHAEDERDEK